MESHMWKELQEAFGILGAESKDSGWQPAKNVGYIGTLCTIFVIFL